MVVLSGALKGELSLFLCCWCCESILSVSVVSCLFHCRLWTTWTAKNLMADKCMWAAHKRKESGRMSSSVNLSRWNRIVWPDTRFVCLPLRHRQYTRLVTAPPFKTLKNWWVVILVQQMRVQVLPCHILQLQFFTIEYIRTVCTWLDLSDSFLINYFDIVMFYNKPMSFSRVSICMWKIWMMAWTTSAYVKNSLHSEP